MEADRTHICQPVFEFTESPTFLLQALLEGSGTVTSSPVEIGRTWNVDAGAVTGTRAENVSKRAGVTLTAIPATRCTFAGWSGKDPDYEDGAVTMDVLTRCIAVFVRDAP